MSSPPDEATPATDPRHEYAQRLEARRVSLGRWTTVELRVADGRLLTFLLAGGILAAAFWGRWLAWWWSLVPAVVFVALVVASDRIGRASRRAGRAVAYYEGGLRRLDGSWAGTGTAGTNFLDPEHPYSADLDLFGVGSLFERLCTARTRAGEERLASWLLAPAVPSVIRERQNAVSELRPRLDFRESVALLGADVRESVDPDALAAWGTQPRSFPSHVPSIIAAILGVLGLASLALWLAGYVGPGPLFLVVMADLGFSALIKRRVRSALDAVERRTHDLALIAELLARLERETYRSPLLVRLREALQTDGAPASQRIGRLSRLLNMIDQGSNQIIAPFAALVFWKTHLAIAVDRWRASAGPAISGWLAAVGEFEALESLAAYAFENPADPFPELLEGEPVFEGAALGHPLIPQETCVANDVSLGGDLHVLLVSGSNMSGKSTLLRTVGINAVLAQAGAPVRANSLKMSPLAIGATLRVQDSLQAGKSRFYAELTRIRKLVTIAEGRPPLLFLLDEIFHGTNSHDRTVGAGAVIRGLIDRGAIGFVTTHDLALAALADQLAPKASNVHFEDQLVNGTLHFDYRMRPGVVTHSNALALMKAVGLEV